MKYEALGATEISVSKICIGGMSFGKDEAHPDVWALDEKETEAMIGHAFDLGVNFIDTANAYAMGKSEEMIGKAVRSLGIPRDKIVIATKVFFNEGKLKKEAILREIDLSLKRLQMDYVDLYQIHRFDYDTPIEETINGRVQIHFLFTDRPVDQRSREGFGQGTDLIGVQLRGQFLSIFPVDRPGCLPVPDDPDGDHGILFFRAWCIPALPGKSGRGPCPSGLSRTSSVRPSPAPRMRPGTAG